VLSHFLIAIVLNHFPLLQCLPIPHYYSARATARTGGGSVGDARLREAARGLVMDARDQATWEGHTGPLQKTC
jgi:hypothetical protein